MNVEICPGLPYAYGVVQFFFNFILDSRKTYENNNCNCSEKYNFPSWCQRWEAKINMSFCVLNGGLKSKLCPGALQLKVKGKSVDDYISSDTSICNEAARM